MGLFWNSEEDVIHSGFYNVLTVSKGFCRDFQPVGCICGNAKNFKRRYNTKRDNRKIAEGVIRGCIESHVSFSFPFFLLPPYLSLLPSSLFPLFSLSPPLSPFIPSFPSFHTFFVSFLSPCNLSSFFSSYSPWSKYICSITFMLHKLTILCSKAMKPRVMGWEMQKCDNKCFFS